MANVATQLVPLLKTLTTSSASAINRGQRVFIAADGNCQVATAATRGDYVAVQNIPVSSNGLGAFLQQGVVPILSASANNAGDLAYSAANGSAINASASAVLLGKFAQASTGSGILVPVELFSVQ